ncbi:MAG TPA: twin-arginine translocase TatA/TatE family subunit [Armatimonadota bacterium]|jgi:sec-independent protein translocase protein TatA
MSGLTTFAFGNSPADWAIIAVVALVLFGAKKLPEMAKGLGEGMKEFKKAVREVNEDEPTPAPKAEATTEEKKPTA